MDDLVERLRARQYSGQFHYEGTMPVFPLCNPDGPEAADRIEKLEAENARLRERRLKARRRARARARFAARATLSDNRGVTK